jgi:hypothetical protein
MNITNESSIRFGIKMKLLQDGDYPIDIWSMAFDANNRELSSDYPK